MEPGLTPARVRSPRVDLAIDVAIGAAWAVVLVAITAGIPTTGGERPIDAVGVAALVVAGGAMGFCRRLPEVAVALVTVALVVQCCASTTAAPSGSRATSPSRRSGGAGAGPRG